MKVAIYTTPTCAYCKMTKEFFKENKVKYTEYDVAVDVKKAEEMVKISGQMGVPVITVEDDKGEQDVVVGFDKKALMGLLGIKE